MAADVVFGPAPPHPHRLSISSSSQSSPSSSESPKVSNFSSYHVGGNGVGADDTSDDIVPKIEELDDDEDVKLSPIDEAASPISPTVAIAKRPRGRPRKHPIALPSSNARPPKGRSKTGCITCRRRKKKCDETKPHCIHCQKNNVHCEGYPPKEYWRSGKQKALEARRLSLDHPPRDLPLLIAGVETDLDRHFLDHFNFNLSKVLSLFTERNNPFKEVLLPMALRHKGLMHSILCLSGSHLVKSDPRPQFHQRQIHHFQQACENLRTDKNMEKAISGDTAAVIEDPTVAQTLVLCLRSICAGEVNGEYRLHLDAAKHMIKTQPPSTAEFQSFVLEFFIFHDVASSITSVDHRTTVLLADDFALPDFMVQPDAGALLGVVDGLFLFLSRIRALRDRIRERKAQGLRPLVDYQILSDAATVDSQIRQWNYAGEEGTPRYVASLLYRQTTWLYLHRTILPSAPSESLKEAVDAGLEYLKVLPKDATTQSILLMPVFLLGCCAFDKTQRPPIMEAFQGLEEYSNLGNIKYARIIVEKIWDMMDTGDEESWDWEQIIKNQGWDFLVT